MIEMPERAAKVQSWIPTIICVPDRNAMLLYSQGYHLQFIHMIEKKCYCSARDTIYNLSTTIEIRYISAVRDTNYNLSTK